MARITLAVGAVLALFAGAVLALPGDPKSRPAR